MIDLLVIGACIVPFVMLKRKIFRKRDKQDGGIITNSASTLDGKTAYVEPKGFDNTSNNCKQKDCPKYTTQYSCPKNCDKKQDPYKTLKINIKNNEKVLSALKGGTKFRIPINNKSIGFEPNHVPCQKCILEDGIAEKTIRVYDWDAKRYLHENLCLKHGWV